ncbi:MAG: DUF2062 domain-containing protein [Inhella sp.]|jgi:uncharacterized protein (DUF2062 family)|nr:DUF2062 domain-containing protein [Inhella sp.]
MPASKLARRWLPRPDQLASMKGLGWLGRYLQPRPWLWVAHRRKVALGAAVGVAVGVIPLPTQMVLAAGVALALRCNVAAAVAATWLTNPFTLVPIWGLALWLGSFFVPASSAGGAPALLALDWLAPATWWPAVWAWVQALGPAWLVGMPLAGLALGSATYAIVFVLWTLVVRLERRRRLRRQGPR